jgi:hypothetical protein
MTRRAGHDSATARQLDHVADAAQRPVLLALALPPAEPALDERLRQSLGGLNTILTRGYRTP